MDTNRIEALGLKPIDADLKKIASISSTKQLFTARVRSHIVLDIAELALGNFKPVGLETPSDQLASPAQHGIISVIVAIAIQAWRDPNPVSFLISSSPGVYARHHTSVQNQYQQGKFGFFAFM